MKIRMICIALALSISLSSWAQKKDVTIDDLWKSYSFYPEYVRGLKSMKGGDYYTQIDKNKNGSKLNKYSYRTGKLISTIADSEKLGIPIADYSFSNDEKKILFACETEDIYRYSSRSVYYVYDINNRSLNKIIDQKVMYATFSPDGKQVAYVKDNNLFLMNLESKQEIQITNDGINNKIINGASDWVYEEEFGLVNAFFWSPDGKKIAFYRFDESEVKEFSMDMFQGELYPTQYEFRYPKAGEENSKISIHLYDTKTKITQEIVILEDFEYLPRLGWTKDPNSLYLIRMNRHQNHLDFLLIDATTTESRVLFS